jgi:hypothetical protein
MLEMSTEDKFFTWQHLDAECLNGSDLKLYEIVEQLFKDEVNWGVVFTNYDAYAAYNVSALKEVGGWDWKRFPYYFLDNDLHHKLKNKNFKLIKTSLPVNHEFSKTIKTSEERNKVNKYTFQASEKLYEDKWGGNPTNETIFLPKKFNKIFQIGFNKCGTTSLHKFFKANDLKSIHWGDAKLAKKIVENHKLNKPILSEYEDYDCYTDMESSDDNIFIYLTHFKELDKQYPNSKFILNVRDVDLWIQSKLNHPSYLDSYKSITGLDTNSVIIHWREIWDKHIKNVTTYFKNRDNDFLMFNIENESDKLINFMSKFTTLKDKTFGHFHKTSDKQKK